MRPAILALRLWWRFRRLRRAWRIIHLTDKLMANISSQKRQEFWREFIYHHNFRKFACQKFNQDLLK